MKNGYWCMVSIFLAGLLVAGATVILWTGEAIDRDEFEAFEETVDERHEKERDVRTEILKNQADMNAKLGTLIEEVRRLRD